MKHDLQDYKFDLIAACSHIENFIGEMSSTEYDANLMVRRAVEREFEIIGEILKRLSLDFPVAYSSIPDARRIIDFRNVISHGYDVIDTDRIYKIAMVNLPKLKEAVQSL